MMSVRAPAAGTGNRRSGDSGSQSLSGSGGSSGGADESAVGSTRNSGGPSSQTNNGMVRKTSLPALSTRAEARALRYSTGSSQPVLRESSTVLSLNQRTQRPRADRTQLCNIIEQQPVTSFAPDLGDQDPENGKAKRDYIVKWLANVDRPASKCESPAIFDVYHDPDSVQTDTAIHIVYDG